jgi:hypothetical protein
MGGLLTKVTRQRLPMPGGQSLPITFDEGFVVLADNQGKWVWSATTGTSFDVAAIGSNGTLGSTQQVTENFYNMALAEDAPGSISTREAAQSTIVSAARARLHRGRSAMATQFCCRGRWRAD